MKKIIILLIIMGSCSGCTIFGFGTKKAIETPKELSKLSKKLNDNPRPVKSLELRENEKKALWLAKYKVSEASMVSTEQVVKSILTKSLNLLEILTCSIGSPTANIENTQKEMNSIIENLGNENKKFEIEKEIYIGKMEENRILIARLQGLINAKVESEQSLLDKVKFWTVVAIILSVAIAVLVPGGSLIVNRIWSKGAETFVSGAKVAGNAVNEMSSAISKYMQSIDIKEQEELKKYFLKMKGDATNFWDSVKDGNNPLLFDIMDLPNNIKGEINEKENRY